MKKDISLKFFISNLFDYGYPDELFSLDLLYLESCINTDFVRRISTIKRRN